MKILIKRTNLKLFVSLDKPCVKSDYNIVEWESEKVGKKRRDNGYLRLVYDKGGDCIMELNRIATGIKLVGTND